MIVISKSLTLGDWYQLKNQRGECCRQWVRQDILVPEPDSIEYLRQRDVTDVHIFPNIVDTLGVIFLGSLSPLNRTFKSIYDIGDRGFMSWERAEEAKREIDRFLIKYAKLKIFS